MGTWYWCSGSALLEVHRTITSHFACHYRLVRTCCDHRQWTVDHRKNGIPGELALLPVTGTALVLMAGQHARWGPQCVLSLKPLQWIGARSYSIYLWHWPVLIIAESHVGRGLTVSERLIAIVCAVIAASLSHHFLENPVRHSVSLQAKPRLALMVGGVDRLKSRCWTCFAKFVSCSQHRCCCRSSSSDRCYYVNSRLPKSTTIPSETTTIPDGPPHPLSMQRPQLKPSLLVHSPMPYQRIFNPHCVVRQVTSPKFTTMAVTSA